MERRLFVVLGVAGLVLAAFPASGDFIDLTHAHVVARADGAQVTEQTALRVLLEEVEKRAGLRWDSGASWPESGPVIALVSGKCEYEHEMEAPKRPERPESYVIHTDAEDAQRPVVWLIGADGRGLLYAVGRFLRVLDWDRGTARLPGPLEVAEAPAYPLRGHQLGYRARANSYDAWDAVQYEQYIRELAFFGVNAIENIPFEDDDPSPHMKLEREAMNIELGRICAAYDLEYWVWSPATFDLTDTEKRGALLRKHEDFFAACPRLDAVFFPGGDPGDNHPKEVMPFLEALAIPLMQHHPRARIWISLQGFDPGRVSYFYRWLNEHRPDWLGGVVAGPGSPPIPATRAHLPRQYALRHYPDITHTVRCQYPTPWWDPAFAFTLGREPVNPEPVRYAAVHNVFAPYTCGFITYSDGIHDDINKVIWSTRGWDPHADVREVLIEYCRLFFHPRVAEQAADGILALERNWQGPLALNGGVDATLALWQGLEQAAPELAGNWRWQCLLLRAYYDAYVRHRLINEVALEAEANAALAQAVEMGPDAAMDAALAVLRRADAAPVRPELRTRVVGLCEALYRSIGLQTSVEKYHASGAERGAVLDYLDFPLNNRWWLEDEFEKVRALSSDAAKLARLDEIRRWEDPGPGGCYDDIGNVAKSGQVIRGEDSNTDPNNDRSPNPDCMWWQDGRTRARQSWVTYMDWPLGLRYEGVDPEADYVVRTTGNRDCLLRVNGERVKPAIDGRGIGEIKEFVVPRKLYQDGLIVLTFDRPLEPGLNWRDASRLTEVWLIRK